MRYKEDGFRVLLDARGRDGHPLVVGLTPSKERSGQVKITGVSTMFELGPNSAADVAASAGKNNLLYLNKKGVARFRELQSGAVIAPKSGEPSTTHTVASPKTIVLSEDALASFTKDPKGNWETLTVPVSVSSVAENEMRVWNTRFSKQSADFSDDLGGTPPTAPKVNPKLPPALRGPLQQMYDSMTSFVKKGTFGFTFTSDLADMAAETLPSIRKYMDLMREKVATKNSAEQRIETILQDFEKLSAAERGTGEGSVNEFIRESTLQGKWGYGPNADPVMKAKFDALPSDAARNVVKRVFEHGKESLKLKQKMIRQLADSEYADLLKAAKDDPAETKRLEKERDASLTAYQGLLKLTDATPYAPLKRFGPYAVVARSAEFEAAVEAGDTKFVEANQTKPEHNVVSFYETMGQAKAAEAELRKQGLNAHAFDRDAGRDYIQGGLPMLQALGRLRELVNADFDEGPASKATAAMNRMISDLYLGALQDTSARQNEHQRVGILVAGSQNPCSFGFMFMWCHLKMMSVVGFFRYRRDLFNALGPSGPEGELGHTGCLADAARTTRVS